MNPDIGPPGLTDSAIWPPFSSVVSVCHCADMEPHVHMPSMNTAARAGRAASASLRWRLLDRIAGWLYMRGEAS